MEIERKYLVKTLPNLSGLEFYELEQSYINFSPEIRIRKQDNECFLTFKSDGKLSRKEVEINIDLEVYKDLKSFSDNNSIYKTRYIINENNYKYELDIYHNIKDLLTVEVEFNSEEESNNFKAPDWFGKEITYINEFKNKNLAKNGFPKEFIIKEEK